MYRYKLISLKVPRNKGRFIQNLWDRGRQILISLANDLIYANVSLNFSKGYKKFKTQNCPPPLQRVQIFSPPLFVTYPKKTYKLFSHTLKNYKSSLKCFAPTPLQCVQNCLPPISGASKFFRSIFWIPGF